MNVYVYPADYYGCGHYRSVWPAMAVGDAHDDIHVTIVPPGHPDGLSAVIDRNGGVIDIMYPPNADLIVLQRPTHDQLSQAVTILRSRGIAVVIDIDDDLSCVHPANPAWLIMHPRTSTAHSWNNVTRACRDATMVTVSSVALQRRYGAHGRVALLRNCVPQDYLRVPHDDDNVVIGWAGSTHSHPGDMKPMGLAIKRLLAEGQQFMVVGDGTGSAADLALREDPYHTGAIDFGKWASAVAQIGIGVAPLLDSKFNTAKSWLKPLEYAACGVPWIASPRAEYSSLHWEGCGMIADTPKSWEHNLRRLITNAPFRKDLAARGREVAARWTYQANEWRWAEVWMGAIQFERSRPRAVSSISS